MIRINLLPVRAAKKKESLRFQLTIAGLCVVFVIAVSVLVYISAASEASQLTTDITNAENELRTLKAKIGELAKLKDHKKMLENKLKIVTELESNRRGPVDMFTSIGLAVPEKAWLSILKETNRIIILKGYAAYDDVVADFMRNLEASGLGRVELEVAQRGGGRKARGVAIGAELVNFSIRVEKK